MEDELFIQTPTLKFEQRKNKKKKEKKIGFTLMNEHPKSSMSFLIILRPSPPLGYIHQPHPAGFLITKFSVVYDQK